MGTEEGLFLEGKTQFSGEKTFSPGAEIIPAEN